MKESRTYEVVWKNGERDYFGGVSRPDVRDTIERVYGADALDRVESINPTRPGRAE